ncbi:carboxy methyl transferase for protein phosphatase 2A, partial [Ceratobasidium sp. 392]
LPTLFIAECVFVYMAPDASSAIVRWFSETFSRTAGIVYEMFGLQDAFGKARQIDLPGVDTFPTLDSQIARFSSNGLPNAQGRTLKNIRRENIPGSELQRISRLEHLDEIEELELVLTHYAITWGYADHTTTLPDRADQPNSKLEMWGLPTRKVTEEDTL